jgi:hypothetical protein
MLPQSQVSLKGILCEGFEEIELIELFEKAIEHHYFFA